MPVEPIPIQRINEVKAAAVRVIQAYRGLPMLGVNDLKIRSVRDLGDEYAIEGDYHASTPFGSSIEKGSCEIRFTKRDLNVVLGAVKITPSSSPPVFQ